MNGVSPNFLAPPPVVRNSVCGYLLPLRPERLKTFTPDPQNVPAIGQNLTLFLGGATKATASVDAYIEEWLGESGSDAPDNPKL